MFSSPHRGYCLGPRRHRTRAGNLDCNLCSQFLRLDGLTPGVELLPQQVEVNLAEVDIVGLKSRWPNNVTLGGDGLPQRLSPFIKNVEVAFVNEEAVTFPPGCFFKDAQVDHVAQRFCDGWS